ncbi:acyltransferase family protein [Methylobacillus flagellatus]|nr:acyltransferase family protein [Methylobacillus flagellatus]
MVLVVLGHNLGLWQTASKMGVFIYLFHMPLFFFITGLTLKLQEGKAYYVDKVISLIATYLILSIIMLPIISFFNPDAQLIDIVSGIFYGTGHTIQLVPMWFIPCLALAVLITYLSNYLLSNLEYFKKISLFSRYLIFALVLLVLGILSIKIPQHHFHTLLAWGNFEDSGPLWSADVAIVGAAFIYFGGAFRLWIAAREIDQVPVVYLTSIVLISLVFMIAIMNLGAAVDLNFRKINEPGLAIPAMVLGIALIVSFSIIVTKLNFISKLLIIVGQSTLVILWLHNGLQNRFINLFMSPGPYSWILGFAIGLLVPVLIDVLIIKKCKLISKFIYPKFSGYFKS